MASTFLYGFILPHLVVPLPAMFLLIAPLLLAVAATLLDAGDPVFVLTGVIILTPGPVLACWVSRKRTQIEQLSGLVDGWHHYRLLEDEMWEVRHGTQSFIDTFAYFCYRGCIVMMLVICNASLCSLDLEQPWSVLMLPCWTPIGVDDWTTAGLLQLYQTLAVILSSFLYFRVTAYMVATTLLLGAQIRLMIRALVTLRDRVDRLLGDRDGPSAADRDREYVREMQAEIINCVAHYQKICRSARLLEEICRPHADMSYYLAMWLWCMLGVQLTMEGLESFSARSLILLSASISTTMSVSIIAEVYDANFDALRDAVYSPPWYEMPLACRKTLNLFQVMLLRRPGIRTSLGMSVNIENFSKTLNGAYCYFSFIITVMNKK